MNSTIENKKTTQIPKKVVRVEKDGFKERLKKALDKEGFPPINRGRIQRLADMMDLSHRGAGKWLDGDTTPPSKKCPILAEKLHINAEWLISGKGNMIRETAPGEDQTSAMTVKEVPLYSIESLNNPYRTPSQMITCYVSSVGKLFALTVDTEALSPRFPVGSVIIFDAGRIPKDGDFVLAQTAHFPTPQFRQLFVTKQGKSLEADNPKFDRIYLNTSDKILGVMLQAVLFY